MKNKFLKITGYSAIELLFALFIVIGLILMTHGIFRVIAKDHKNNQIADQIKIFEKAAIMYLTDNYRDIMLQIRNNQIGVIVPAISTDILPGFLYQWDGNGQRISYLHNGVLPTLITGQIPCLYISKEKGTEMKLDSNIKAYLIFGNRGAKLKPLSYKDAMAVANTVGGTAGVVQNTVTGMQIKGLNFNGIFDPNLDLLKQCGFSYANNENIIPNNSIIIDLTLDNNFFQQLVSINNTNNDKKIPPQNPALQKSGSNDSAGMRTNLYLDNVISEARTEISYYCDTSQASIYRSADGICQDFANKNGYSVVSGSSYWYSSVKTGERICTGTAKANFTRIISNYTCDGVNLPDPNSYNNASSQTGFINATWSAATLNGNKCIATDVVSLCGQYTSTMNTAGDCHWKSISCTPGTTMHTDGCQGGHGRPYLCGTCSTGPDPFDHDGCWSQYCSITQSPINYATISVDAIQINRTQSIGEMTCGIDNDIPATELTTDIPAQHRYRSLNLGDGAISGQKIQIKSNATAGAAINTSKLDISHAGIQSGTIAIVSHLVMFGDVCQSTELGKMAQQRSSADYNIQAQLACTYSPVSCPDPGYCYLPVKSASREIHFNQKQQSAICPNELVVDANQPSDLLDTNIPCPDLTNQGYINTQKVHVEAYGCYESGMSKISFCTGVKSLCTYKDNNNMIDYPVTALLGIQCVAKSNTFVIDNYKQ